MSNYRKLIIYIFIILPLIGFTQPKGVKITKQQNTEKTRILFVVDCSNNMNEKWQSDTKIKITQALLSNIVDTLSQYPQVEVGLRVFGNEKDYSLANCDDSHLIVPFYRLNAENVKAKLKALVPKGTPCVAKSLLLAGEDFPKEKKCRNIVILIVDNIDKCDGDVESISKQMQKQGRFLKPFIIGISKGMKNIYEDCGYYCEANGEIEFTQALNSTIKQALHNTTVQVNLLDSYMESTETNVPLTFYDNQTKNLKYSFVHTFNSKGISDTLSIDPLVKYDLVVHTIPPIKQENITINAGSHTIIPIKSAQGTMVIKYISSSKSFAPKNYPVVVRQQGQRDIINVQDLNKAEKYLVGKYDLEVLSLPRLEIENVEVGQSSTTTIEIPECGTLKLEKQKADITGAIFVKNQQETKWVKNINADNIKQSLDLLPGEYMIVAKSKASTKATSTIVQEFKIESNKVTNIILSVKK